MEKLKREQETDVKALRSRICGRSVMTKKLAIQSIAASFRTKASFLV
jgi:hypothetical protein